MTDNHEGTPDDHEKIPDDHEGMLYTPPEGSPGAGTMYPRAVRLDAADPPRASGEPDDVLLATFEHYHSADPERADQPFFPVYRSVDGGRSWEQFSEIHDTEHGWGLRYQPALFELPEPIGPWEAGTVLAAGNAIPADRSRTSIDVYASEDGGESWSYVSTVATGGEAAPQAGNTPVWEPEFAIDAAGNLVCYFADERHSDDGYDQLVGHRVSRDGGQTWDEQVFDAAIPDGSARPGMPVVTRLPDGSYAMVFEVVGPEHGGDVYLKTSPDGTDWGDPTDLGHLVATDEGYRLRNGPTVAWVPTGGDDGTLLVAAKTLRDGDGDPTPGSGSTLLATTDPSGEGPWVELDAPLSYADEVATENRAVAWTTDLIPLRNGTELLQLTSTHRDGGRCEIRYAIGGLPLGRR